MLNLYLKPFVQGRLEAYVSKLHLCMDLVVTAITIVDTLMHDVPYRWRAPGHQEKLYLPLGYLGSSYLYKHRSNVIAFADGRNVRHKLSTALTSARTVTNNEAIDSRYFLESRIKHARK